MEDFAIEKISTKNVIFLDGSPKGPCAMHLSANQSCQKTIDPFWYMYSYLS